MRTRKILSLFLIITMMMPLQIFAMEEPETSAIPEEGNISVEEIFEEESPSDTDIQEGVPDPAGEVEQEELIPSETAKESETDKNIRNNSSAEWCPEDFTYGEGNLASQFTTMPASASTDKLEGTINIITGFSESGAAKLENNKDLVIPAVDTSGNTVQGIGQGAFSGKGLTSLTLPEEIRTANNGKWDSSVEMRGDFFIGNTAFSSNELTSLVIPEGVILIGGSAFKNNKLTSVSFPSTLMIISNQAFATNELETLSFTETTDFALQIDSMAFAQNSLTEVYLPAKTEKVTRWAFFQNTGMEPVTSGTALEKQGGIVYFHIKDPGNYIDDITKGTCNVQKLIVTDPDDPGPGGDDPDDPIEDEDEWLATDFTYKEYSKLMYGCDYTRQLYVTGPIITGFSDSGLNKLGAGNTDIVIPSKTPEGVSITGIGNEAFKGKGLTSVSFPTGMLVPYDDTVSHTVSRRGNFIIHESAFANNELTEVYLPAGVLGCMANSFKDNKITKVTFPRTIWWIETLAFANNEISRVDFPQTCDFRMEMHGMTFARNNIKSVRLPDYTEVVNKDVFAMNPGMEPMTEEIAKKRSSTDWQKYMKGGEAESGIVYMYTDREALFDAQRIHTLDRPTKNQWSPFQKLVLISGTTPDADTEKWNTSDFNYEGTVVTGLSESGKEKRKTNNKLDIPDRTPNGELVTEIASSDNINGGLFGEEIRDEEGNVSGVEGFEIVTLPNDLRKIGDGAFRALGLKEVIFPNQIQEIGMASFQMNEIKDVILPDSVTAIGGGAFASNPTIRQISIPHNRSYKVIEEGTFGCSDMKNWMTDLTSIEIPDTVTEIKDNAFAGNNFETIDIPASVKSIGRFAFSTKNYLQTPTTLILHDGLETIGNRAFRNKKIENVVLPATVEALPANAFEKVDTDWDTGHGVSNPLITRVFVPTEEQYNDKDKFPDSEWHKIYLGDPKVWTAEDYEYDEIEIDGAGTVVAVTGFSEHGVEKFSLNTKITLPVADENGSPVIAVAPEAFAVQDTRSDTESGTAERKLTGLTIPANSIRYIGENAFKGNDLSHIEFGEGVERIGRAAFMKNKLTKVSLPMSLSLAGEESFASNSLKTLEFANGGSADLSIEDRAFAENELRSLQVPDNLDTLSGTAFEDNPGMPDETGVVILYKLTETGSSLECITDGTSECQDIIFGEIPPELAPWGPRHFTFSDHKITGFSADGEAKLAVDPYVYLPGVSGDGTVITTVGERAFADYYGDENKKYGHTDPKTKEAIKGVEFAPSINTIELAAFQMCAIEDIVLPDSITTVGSGAFASNYGMKSITLSGSLTAIPDSAFITNVPIVPDMESLVIPEGVASIGDSAFRGQCIKNLELPSTLTEIGDEAFLNHKLTVLDIPASVRKIGTRAFELRREGADTFLTELILHEGLEEINSQAFGQTALNSVEIPSSLKVLARDAFVDFRGNGHTDGRPVYLRTSNKNQANASGKYTGVSISGKGHRVVYDKMVGTGWSYDDFEYSDDGTVIIGWSDQGEDKRKEYASREEYPPMVMPDKPSYDSDTFITEIGEKAFQLELYNESTGTGEVTMQKFDCDSPYGIQRLVFPEKLEKIGACAFEYNNLKAVDLGSAKRLTSIGMSAFHGNHLVTVDIPDTVKELGGGAFAMNNITDLTLSKNVTVIPQGCFSMNIFMYEIEIPDTVTEIGEEAFAGARLEALDIPASVTKIGKKAFHLHHLTTLHIPGNVKYIGDSAFEGTFKESTLKWLTFGEGVEYIGRYAFKEALLEEVYLPYSLQEMGVDPFYSNKGKDGSGVVILYSTNRNHLAFNDDKYHGKENGVSRHCHKVIYAESPVDNTKAVGTEHKVSSGTVRITSGSAKTVSFVKAANKKSISVPAYVKIGGDTFTVTDVASYAFRGSKATTVTIGKNVRSISKYAFRKSNVKTLKIKTKKLTKKSVKNSLKGSKVTTVKVKVGSKKLNKKYAKKYKKYFTKKNAGKKVKVR